MNVAISDFRGTLTIDFKNESFLARALPLGSALEEAGVTRLDFIKMDVEGLEKVIVPISIDLMGRARFVSMELHGDQSEVRSMLETRGFRQVPLSSGDATLRVASYLIRHPIRSLLMYSRVRMLSGYSFFELMMRVLRGLGITREQTLQVVLFRRP